VFLLFPFLFSLHIYISLSISLILAAAPSGVAGRRMHFPLLLLSYTFQAFIYSTIRKDVCVNAVVFGLVVVGGELTYFIDIFFVFCLYLFFHILLYTTT
jgi:hypothetical protein